MILLNMLTMDHISIHMRMTQSYFFIKTMEDSATLQKDLDSLIQWMETWLLKLNIGKCKAIPHLIAGGMNLIRITVF